MTKPSVYLVGIRNEPGAWTDLEIGLVPIDANPQQVPTLSSGVRQVISLTTVGNSEDIWLSNEGFAWVV